MTRGDPLVGRWKITEMGLWHKADLDHVEPAYLVFEPDGMGAIGFICVAGGIDYRVVERDGQTASNSPGTASRREAPAADVAGQ